MLLASVTGLVGGGVTVGMCDLQAHALSLGAV